MTQGNISSYIKKEFYFGIKHDWGFIGVMKRKRDTSLVEYGISEYAYREMIYFCMQYGEKKEKLNDLYSIKAINYDKAVVDGGAAYDGVFDKAQKAAIIKSDVEIIEKAASEAASDIKDRLIDNVCYEIPFEYMDVPCGRRQFYDKRKLFFIILNRYLNERKKG